MNDKTQPPPDVVEQACEYLCSLETWPESEWVNLKNLDWRIHVLTCGHEGRYAYLYRIMADEKGHLHPVEESWIALVEHNIPSQIFVGNLPTMNPWHVEMEYTRPYHTEIVVLAVNHGAAYDRALELATHTRLKWSEGDLTETEVVVCEPVNEQE